MWPRPARFAREFARSHGQQTGPETCRDPQSKSHAWFQEFSERYFGISFLLGFDLVWPELDLDWAHIWSSVGHCGPHLFGHWPTSGARCQLCRANSDSPIVGRDSGQTWLTSATVSVKHGQAGPRSSKDSQSSESMCWSLSEAFRNIASLHTHTHTPELACFRLGAHPPGVPRTAESPCLLAVSARLSAVQLRVCTARPQGVRGGWLKGLAAR